MRKDKYEPQYKYQFGKDELSFIQFYIDSQQRKFVYFENEIYDKHNRTFTGNLQFEQNSEVIKEKHSLQFKDNFTEVDIKKSSITRSGITEPLEVKLYEEYDYNLRLKSCSEFLKILMFVFLGIGVYYAGWASYLQTSFDKEFDESICTDDGSLLFQIEP